ncbi:hypothetical protein GCM10010430_18430 [Kitasatospora cystarginea]|uniref:Uncharacterized protein n=1 Tax=Kitasatospora cystarginea TaxID=58350 RepID=A0ABN3DNR7_9ACTN
MAKTSGGSRSGGRGGSEIAGALTGAVGVIVFLALRRLLAGPEPARIRFRVSTATAPLGAVLPAAPVAAVRPGRPVKSRRGS